jgi:hypothetical protein
MRGVRFSAASRSCSFVWANRRSKSGATELELLWDFAGVSDVGSGV